MMKYKINFNNLKDNTHLFFNVFLEQTIQNIGTFTDHDDYVFPTTPLTNAITLRQKFGRVDNSTLYSYVTFPTYLTFQSDSRIEALRPYGYDEFTTSLVLNEKNIVHAGGYPSVMGDKMENITTSNGETTYNYFIDGLIIGIGMYDTTFGFVAEEKFVNGSFINASFTFKTQGNNFTNSSLLPIIKLDHLIGITDVLETKSDLFINRGKTSAYESMLKLGDINNLEQLSMYGNGFFNIINE